MGRKTNSQIDWSLVRLVTISQVARAFLSQFLVVIGISILLGSLLQACGGGGGGGGLVTNLKSITIEPVNSSIAAGTTLQLHATGHYKNKTTKDLTDKVTWSSSTASVANVSNTAGSQGLVTGGTVGATTITVKLHGKKGVSTFTVTGATLTSITLSPVNPLVAKGTTVQLVAQGHFSDGSVQDLTTQVSWSSANAGIAQVSNASGTLGLVTGVTAGNTPIAATFKGVGGATTITVTAATLTSITITVPNGSIADGTSTQLTATCNFSDGTTQDCTRQASCSSGNTAIVQVSETPPGLITGTGVGSTSVSCTFGGIQGSATETVTNETLTSITITPPNPSFPEGIQQQLTATGNFSGGSTQDLTTQVSWSQDDATIAQVSNVIGTQGLVTGLSVGNTLITATLNGISGSTTVNVTDHIVTAIVVLPAVFSIAKGATQQLSATCNFSDNTTGNCSSQASWTQGNPAVAQVSNVPPTEGLVTGTGVGNTSITATLNGVSGSATVTVTDATIATIAIIVNPANATIPLGLTAQLTATCNFSDGTTSDCTAIVSWTSDNPSIPISNAVVSPGLLTGKAVGVANITATAPGVTGVTGSATVTVTAATLVTIAITPAGPSGPSGFMVPLTATGTFSDNSTATLLPSDVSWTSSDSTQATVDANGLVTGTGAGSPIITATQKSGGTVSGSTTVTVTAATLQTITVMPLNPALPLAPSIAKGTSVPLIAIGNFSDHTQHDITATAHWDSSNVSVATVGNMGSVPGAGLVTGGGVGSVTITATQGGIMGSTMVTVTSATISKLIIAAVFNPPVVPVPPLSVSMATTKFVDLVATAVFSDGSVQDVTKQTDWVSSDTKVATVLSSAPESQPVGRLNPNKVGTTTITGTYEPSPTFQGTLVVNVTK